MKDTTCNISSFKKKIIVDSDKSISIRSFLIGSICNNISKASNVLESEDVFSTINCLKKLGVKILKQKAGKYLKSQLNIKKIYCVVRGVKRYTLNNLYFVL